MSKTGRRYTDDREDDERKLDWLYLHDAGVNAAIIGQRYGVSDALIRRTFQRIGRDLAESEGGA